MNQETNQTRKHREWMFEEEKKKKNCLEKNSLGMADREKKKKRKRTIEKVDLQETQVLKTRFLREFFHSPQLYIS